MILLIQFISLLVLLLAGVARAETSHLITYQMIEQSESHLLLTHEQLDVMQEASMAQYGAHIRIKLIDDPCTKKMEQAMRDVDKFVRGVRSPVNTHLWENTKAQCWTDTP